LGEGRFDAIFTSRSGITFTVDEYDETWRRMETPDRRINLEIPELFEELAGLADAPALTTAEFPFVLSAGGRRSPTPNTINRDPPLRKRHPLGPAPLPAAAPGRAGAGRPPMQSVSGSAKARACAS